MSDQDVSVKLAGELLVLMPEAAVYWPRLAALIIADPHFGKAAAFRAHGVPVPETTTHDNLTRLDGALARSAARRLIVLGDFLHTRRGRSPELFATVSRWRASRAELPMLLVRGNHDDRAGDPPDDWGIECQDEPVTCPPFVWRHKAAVSNEGYVLAGHVHPAVQLSGTGGLSATLPCFYFGKDYGLLPAFGDFTGTGIVRPRPGDRVFVLAQGMIVRKA